MISNYGLQVFIPISLQVNRVIYLTQVITDGALVPTYPLKNLAFLLSTKDMAVNCYKLHSAGLCVTVSVSLFELCGQFSANLFFFNKKENSGTF